MALVLKDRVKETSTTAGTGTLTLAGAVAGFQSFAAVGNGNTTYYAIVDPTTGDWEVGIGTYTSSGTTLSRTTVLSSSNSGSLVNFVANQKDVFVTYPAEEGVWTDASGVVNATSFGAITATSAALTTGTISTTPTANTDIVNKQYVDTVSASGIHYHDPVYVEVPNTFGNLNATYNNGASGVGATLTNAGTQAAFTADGISVPLNSRVLVYNQTNAAQNGVYTLTTVGSGSTNWVLTRATDANTYSPYSPNALGQGDAFFVTNGLTGAGETYICNTVGTITFGTTAITFAQISDSTLYTAGTGLTLSGTEFSITPTGTAGTYGSASSVPVLTTNASGQVTSVTNTTIAINGSQVSGNISGSAGSVANALTLGTYLTGGTYNGSAAVTATVDATSANTASKVVARDSSGNFSAGTITATLSGSATSATTATNLAGGAANQIAYQSASGTTSFATAPSASNQVLNWNGSAFTWSAGTISGVPLGSNLNSLTAGTYLTGTAYNGSAAQTWSVNAASANTASTVVARDASGNFSAGTITAALTGNVTGNASTATTATTALNVTASADQAIVNQNNGNSAAWYGRILSKNSTNDKASFLGTYGSIAGVFAHNNALNAWADLYVNTVDGSTGGVVRLPATTLVNGYQVLQTNNYNSYAPTLTGTGASGTWNINVTGSAGSAGSVAWGNITSKPNYIMFYEGFTLDANTMSTNSTGFTYSNNAPATGPIARFSTGGGYDLWLNAPYGGGGSTLYFRTRNGDTASYNSWQALASYGINYASTLYATIYYDANNTGYYLDPASTSYLSTIVQLGVYTRNAAGAGWLSGNYGTAETGSTTGAIYSIGGSYYPTSGSLNNMYGIGYAVGNVSGIGWTGNWGFYTASGGTSRHFLDAENGIGYASGSYRSPIFYDYNNTGYYVDPASTSILNVIGFNGTSANAFGSYWAGTSGYPAYQYIGGNSRFGFSSTSGYIDVYTDGNYYGGIDLYGANRLVPLFDANQGGGALYSSIVYDSDNTGYYVNPNGTSNIYALTVNQAISGSVTGYSNYVAWQGRIPAETGRSAYYPGAYTFSTFTTSSSGNPPTTYAEILAWGGGGSGAIQIAGDWISTTNTPLFVRSLRDCCQDWSSWTSIATSGVSFTNNVDLRAPIFYDSNNSAYYVDPASTTNLNVLYVGGQPVTGGGGTQAFVAFGSTGGF